MSPSIPIRSVASLIFILFAGCATDDAIPAEQLYQQPAAGTGTSARIKGSMIEDSGLFAAKHMGYVLMIDGKFVLNALENCEQPILLAPGPHDISIEYRYSVFNARTAFGFDAQKNAGYVVKISPGIEGSDERRYCDISIVDASTGQAVTPVKHCYVTGGPAQNRSNFRPLD